MGHSQHRRSPQNTRWLFALTTSCFTMTTDRSMTPRRAGVRRPTGCGTRSLMIPEGAISTLTGGRRSSCPIWTLLGARLTYLCGPTGPGWAINDVLACQPDSPPLAAIRQAVMQEYPTDRNAGMHTITAAYRQSPEDICPLSLTVFTCQPRPSMRPICRPTPLPSTAMSRKNCLDGLANV